MSDREELERDAGRRLQEASDEERSDIREELERIGVEFITIPGPTGDEKLRLEGWRDGIERYGQPLWQIYHWIVKCQDGNTHGIYRLRDWLEEFNVPDNTGQSGEFPTWHEV